MRSDGARYRPAGPVLVRASTAPGDLFCEAAPDVDDPAAGRGGLAWLGAQWARPEIREAISMASPDLAMRVDRLLCARGGTISAIRRAVLTTAAYLLRWQRRTTPFGLFAAVTTATVGPAAATVGERHRAVARVDGDCLARLVDRLEQHHSLRGRLSVVADSAGFVRDGRFIVAGRPEPGQRLLGPPRENSTTYTAAVRLALEYAARPVRFDQLAAHLAARVPHVATSKVDTMLHGLIDGGFLITGLRPPMTAVDGLAYVIETLHSAGAADWDDLAPTLEQLVEIRTQLAGHNESPDPKEASRIRAAATETISGLGLGTDHHLAVDLHLDGQISLPQCALDEAAQAADVLLRMTTLPFGSVSWLDYHARFRERYGPGALVPVRELVADSGLGYPTGFIGAPRARPAWRVLTERDVHLMMLIQKATMEGGSEIRLTDADIDALTVGDHTTMVPPSRLELGVAVYAATTDALDRGEFTLQIAAAPRRPTSMAGRFAYLLDPAERVHLGQSFAASTSEGDNVLAVQVSFPPRRVHNQNVVRVGRLLPDVVSVSEYPDDDAITVDDLAVTVDAEQMYLVHRTTGHPVIAHIPHALDITVQTPPLARFVAEVADARSAVFGPFDHGAAARNLPYIPRIRYGRTILASARWLLATHDLTPVRPADTRPAAQGWSAALQAWLQRWRVPARVVACHGETRLPLDLERTLDQALLRTRLARAGRLELREDAPPHGHDWVGRPAEFLIAMTLTTPTRRRLPVTAPPGSIMQVGVSAVVHAQLIGSPARADELLTAHLPILADSLTGLGMRRWWIKRHRDTIRVETDQYLSLFVRLDDPAAYGTVAARLGEFAAGLHARGLPAQLVLAPYYPHLARYGHGPAMNAAEHVFACDTAAAISQLRLAQRAGLPAQALAAASMAQLAAAFAPTAEDGYRALLACLPHVTQPADRPLTDLARRLADPTDGYRNLRTHQGGDTVVAAWHARQLGLRIYHDTLVLQRDPVGVLRTLLHEHHVRAVGVDPEFERTTHHAARAAALRCLALAGTP